MPDAIVLSASPLYEVDIPRLMAQTVAQLRQLGASAVIVVGPPPVWPDALPTRILRANEFSGANGDVHDTLDLPEPELKTMSRLDVGLEQSGHSGRSHLCLGFPFAVPETASHRAHRW